MTQENIATSAHFTAYLTALTKLLDTVLSRQIIRNHKNLTEMWCSHRFVKPVVA